MTLHQFSTDKELKKEVHEYIIGFIHDEAVRMLFDREDTKGIADAKELVDKAFESMEPEDKRKVNILNEAR